MLKLYNSLTKKVEEFKPLEDKKVGMYTCGPTPYNYQHIGNFRTMIFSDIVLRTLLFQGYQVKSVRNITDVEDKIIKKAKEENQSIEEVTTKYTNIFFDDLNKLNILSVDVSPKATEHIGKMIKYIEELIEKGFAYVEKDGSVYFDISKFPEYGKLSGVEKRELKSGTRILSDEYSKEDIQDFALWKAVEPQDVGWDSPWGKGRPGWHIECSVMSQEYLGDTFDLHLGGIDLIFPHHENEIAQAKAKTGKPFVNMFLHGEFILVDGKKMAKSLGNTYTLKDLEEKGIEPLAFRYLIMTTHYRDKLNFIWESLEASQNALNNLRELVREWEEPKIGCAELEKQFEEALENDLNTPQGLAVMWELIKSDYPTSAKSASLLKMDKVLGLNLEEYIDKKIQVPSEIKNLIAQREEARKMRDFKKSDEIREKIKKLGFELEDTLHGSKVKLSSK